MTTTFVIRDNLVCLINWHMSMIELIAGFSGESLGFVSKGTSILAMQEKVAEYLHLPCQHLVQLVCENWDSATTLQVIKRDIYLVLIEICVGVGYQVLLCDSIDKVEQFRDILREIATIIKSDDDDTFGWACEFFEEVFICNNEGMFSVYKNRYRSFKWLLDTKIPIDYSVCTDPEPYHDSLPLLNHISDYENGEHNLTFEQFRELNHNRHLS
jgi:hypothetical protein